VNEAVNMGKSHIRYNKNVQKTNKLAHDTTKEKKSA
jgi:hypothetical protein